MRLFGRAHDKIRCLGRHRELERLRLGIVRRLHQDFARLTHLIAARRYAHDVHGVIHVLSRAIAVERNAHSLRRRRADREFVLWVVDPERVRLGPARSLVEGTVERALRVLECIKDALGFIDVGTLKLGCERRVVARLQLRETVFAPGEARAQARRRAQQEHFLHIGLDDPLGKVAFPRCVDGSVEGLPVLVFGRLDQRRHREELRKVGLRLFNQRRRHVEARSVVKAVLESSHEVGDTTREAFEFA